MAESLDTKVKRALRLTSTALDQEISDMIEEAQAEMQRVGITPTALDLPLARAAVIAYCKSNYDPDTNAADRARILFRDMVDEMRRTSAYTEEAST